MGPQEREVDLIDYIEVILKWKWLIVVGTLVSVVGYGLFVSLRTSVIPLYQASAQIFIVPSQGQGSLKDTQVELPTLTPEFYQSVALADENRLAMDQLQQALIDSFGLHLPSTPLSLEAEVVDKVRMVMRVSAADTLLAREILYAWVDLFLTQNQELNAAESKRYYKDIAAQYELAKINLTRVDSALSVQKAINLLSAMQNQQEQYKKRLVGSQDTLISAEFELVQKEARLERLREMMLGLEQQGRPIYTLSTADREQFDLRQLPPEAQQMLDYVSALDSLKKALGAAEERYNLLLLEFDREHGFSALSREVEEVSTAIEGYQRGYLRARSQQMTASVNLAAITEELKKHEQVIGNAADGGGMEIHTINPVYTDLEKQQAREGVGYETARVYAERGELELKELQLRLEQAQRNLFAVQQERQALEYRLGRERDSITEQVEFFQKAFDLARRNYLKNKKALDSLEVDVAASRALAKDLRAQIDDLEVKISSVQEGLSAELADNERLEREKKTYSGTFERFTQLSEEARIAQQKAANNLRPITRDAMARPVGPSARYQKMPVSGAVGLLLSTLLAFLIEYVQKARRRRATSG